MREGFSRRTEGCDMHTNHHRLVIARSDLERLRSILDARGRGDDREHLIELRNELEHAHVVSDEDIATDVVRLGSEVMVRDEDSRVLHRYLIVSPSQADVASNHISVIAPLGTALLGYRAGDELEWSMPGGVRRLRIESVQPPRPARAMDLHEAAVDPVAA